VDIFVVVDVEKLNDVLRISRHTQVDEDDDSDKINVEYCGEDDDDEIEKEEENSD